MQINQISPSACRVILITGAVYDVAKLDGESSWFYSCFGDKGVRSCLQDCISHLEAVEAESQQAPLWPVDADGIAKPAAYMTPVERTARFAAIERHFKKMLGQPVLEQMMCTALANSGDVAIH